MEYSRIIHCIMSWKKARSALGILSQKNWRLASENRKTAGLFRKEQHVERNGVFYAHKAAIPADYFVSHSRLICFYKIVERNGLPVFGFNFQWDDFGTAGTLEDKFSM